MDLQQLQAFSVLAQHEHMSQAAQYLGTSQPQVSKLIASLEAELGVQLFDRVGRGIRLNEHGQLFLKYANDAIAIMYHGQMTMRNLKKSILGTITLGTFAFAPILTPCISAYLQENPNVCFHFLRTGGDSRMKMNNADIILSLSFESYQHYSYEVHFPVFRTLLRENYYIVGSPKLLNYPPEKESIRVSEIANMPVIIVGQQNQDRNNDHGILQDINDILDISLPVVCIANDFTLKMTLVSEGAGIAFLPEACLSLAQLLTPDLRIFAIEDFSASRSVILARKRRDAMSSAANDFWNFLLRHYDLPEDYEG